MCYSFFALCVLELSLVFVLRNGCWDYGLFSACESVVSRDEVLWNIFHWFQFQRIFYGHATVAFVDVASVTTVAFMSYHAVYRVYCQ